MASPIQSLQEGTRSNISAEKFAYSYYDKYKLNATTREVRMFTSAVGQNSKTLADTNMLNGGMIPNGKKFVVKEIKVNVSSIAAHAPGDLQHLYSLLEDTTVQFIIDGKQDIGTWLLSELIGLPVGWFVTGTANTDYSQNSTLSTFKGVYPLKVPIVLSALQSFEIKVIHQYPVNAVLNNDIFRITLSGIQVSLN